MKKNLLKNLWLIICVAAISVSVSSCGSKNEPELPTPSNGKLNNPIVVKEGKTYSVEKNLELNSSIIVESGGLLKFSPGVTVTCNGGTSSYITVKQGARIEAKGTANKPIVFTSEKHEPGAWGGIVIAGKAPINVKGGSATIEVGGDFRYGGKDVEDNSGVLQYVRIEYSGARFNAEKEYNGISFFGVGNGTKVDHVSVVWGSDDGVEFFGGTVNVSNLVLLNNEDDQFDFAEGFSGKVENVFMNTGVKKHNRGIEADNNKGNNMAEPISNPTLKNFTIIGTKVSEEKESQAVKLRVGSHGTIENFVIKNWETGFDFENDATFNWFKKGKITKVKFIDVDHKAVTTKKKDGKKVHEDASAWVKIDEKATGAGNGINTPDWAKKWSSLK